MSTPVPRQFEVTYSAAKAKVGALVAAGIGFIAPGAAYLLTVDDNGITTTELVHAVLIALVAAAGSGAAVGGVVYAVENKARTREVPPGEELL